MNIYKWLLIFLLLPILSQGQIISTVAGSGSQGYSGDNGPATAADLASPFGITRDGAGNLYITDYNVIRKISAAGIITTVAGNGSDGFSGDGGPATAAMLYQPFGVSIDGSGNLYIADYGNNRVRKVNTSGIISTIAGGDVTGYAGDGGPATAALLANPEDVSVDGSGNVYISDYNNNVIRRISPTGIINTVAGTGTAGFGGDGGAATAAAINSPGAILADNSGNVYFSDINNHRVRRINPGGVIATVVGNGIAGYSGDGGTAGLASINSPSGVAIDGSHNLYVSDYTSGVVRKINVITDIITTIAGDGDAGYSGDGGPATAASLYQPRRIAADAIGDVYIADWDNFRVRKVDTTTYYHSLDVAATNITTTSLRVYPNPTRAQATFSGVTAPAHILITNTTGQTVADLPVSDNTNVVVWDASRLCAGMYFYEVHGDSGVAGRGSLVISKE